MIRNAIPRDMITFEKAVLKTLMIVPEIPSRKKINNAMYKSKYQLSKIIVT